jgi:putative phosphoesterase
MVRTVKIGILSDTHGKFMTALRAVTLLQQQGVDVLIHCGDVGDEQCLDALAGVGKAYFVFGNNDFDRQGLRSYGDTIGVQCLQTFGVVEVDGKKIAVTHGDDARIMSRLLRADSGIDYLLSGHTHVRDDQRVGTIRWINPGALYRAAIKSVAVLDVASDRLDFLSLPGE